MTRPATWGARAALLALLPLAACARTEQVADNTMAQGQAMVQAQTNPTLSTSDAYFIDQAARSGLAEVQEGALAEQRAARADVRSFARSMVADHGKVNDALTALARQKQIAPPTTPNDAQQTMIGQLQGLTGATFDRQYLDQQVTMHQSAVSLFRTEAAQGTDPQVKAFAARMLPELEHHLDMAEQLGGHTPTT